MSKTYVSNWNNWGDKIKKERWFKNELSDKIVNFSKDPKHRNTYIKYTSYLEFQEVKKN